MKTYGYIRRSSSERNRANYSVASQKRICESLAKRDGRMIQKWVIDYGASGTTLQRPHLQKMLREIANEKEDQIFLYIWMASRLSRDVNHCNSLRYVFRKYNVTVISANNDWVSLEDIEENPDLAIGARIVNISDEAEVRRDRKRTYTGLITTAKNGNYPHGSANPPIGWKFLKKSNNSGRKIEIDPDSVNTILYILQLVHDEKRSLESIVRDLNSKHALEIKWTYQKLHKLVTNPLLYGRLLTKYVDIEGHSPAYCSKKYFEEMQMIMSHRKKEMRYKYLFKNMVICHQCRILCTEIPTIHYSSAHSRRNKKIYKYYYCPNCNKRINETKLLREIVPHIRQITTSKDNIEFTNNLKLRLERIRQRLVCINEEYDNGYLDYDKFKEEREEALIIQKKIEIKIRNLENRVIKRFSEYEYIEQKSLIKKTFISIYVDFKEKPFTVIEVKKHRN